MSIDWFTVFAQMVNFLVLVFLLKRFLYAPIVQVMEDRRNAIVAEFQAAEESERKAEEEGRRLHRERREIEESRDRLLEVAQQEVESQKRKLVEEARAEVLELRRTWVEDLDRERVEQAEDLRRTVGATILDLSRRALLAVCDARLERRAIDLCLRELEELPAESKREMVGSEPIRVRTAFALSEAARDELGRRLHQEFGCGNLVEFRCSDREICGLEILTAGRVIRWGIEPYLQELEDRLKGWIDVGRDRSKVGA